MVNEVTQWVLLLSLALLVLGLYRQYATAMGIGDSQLLPAVMGPRPGRKISAQHLERLNLGGRPGLVMFVSDSCASCHRLLAQVQQHMAEPLDQLAVSIVAVRSSPDFVEALRRLSVGVVDDANGELSSALEVGATPFIITLDAKGAVRAKAVESDVARILQAAAQAA